MITGAKFVTIDNVSRLAIVWTYSAALLALWFRLEYVAKEAKRAQELAGLALDVAHKS